MALKCHVLRNLWESKQNNENNTCSTIETFLLTFILSKHFEHLSFYCNLIKS